MIHSVRGPVLSVAGSLAVIDVGGVGYAVTLTPQHALALRQGSEVLIHTALVVREDEMALFGFDSADALAIFTALRGVTGVGPKSAMAVLATVPPGEVVLAVAEERDAVFRAVSGIGPKTAKLIVLSLAGKLQQLAVPGTAPAPAAARSGELLQALVGLGWSERIAAPVIDEVLAEADDGLATPALLRLALARLGTGQPSRSGAGV